MKSAAFASVAVSAWAFASVQAQQPAWGQCGGIGWTGGTTCVSGYVCSVINDFYWQCIPGTATTTAPTTGPGPTNTTPAPSATASISPAWATAVSKAKTYLARFSQQNKIDLVTGIQWQKGHCVGNTAPITAVNFPGLCLQDGPLGIRQTDKVSAFPAGINAAATWNRDLMRQRGAAMGAEFKGKGVNVALGPAMNMIRSPMAGRNWEGFGADPYLAGEAAYETIIGMQSSGVQACAKHYVNNEQERNRETSSSNVDDRTQHEIYLPPFLKSVQADVASFMCSYNQVNGTFLCENDKLLNGILKTEFGFPGYVMSDWWATHSTISAARGLDMTMPGDTSINSGQTYFGSALMQAVNSGTVSQARLDDMATRILAGWYLLGQDSGYPAVNFHTWNVNDGFNKHVDVQGNHGTLIRQIGAASHVLLKNINNALPLNKPASIAVIGNDAGPGRGPNAYTDRAGNDGILGMGWGSGTVEYPYLITPQSAITTRANSDGSSVTSSLSDTDLTAAANAARGKTVALVFITADSGEGYLTVEGHAGDRNNLQAWHSGDQLVAAVAAVNRNTIVVVHTVGAIVMEPWINHANVTAVVWAGLQGQEAGNSLVDVLHGTVNPSGRLPYTIAKSASDYPYPTISSSQQISYSEGLKVDYRWFDANNIAPRYEFGFGLSYTNFTYSGLSISGSVGSGTAPTGPGSSLDPWLHTKVITVSFTLANSGSRAGTEIPQLYIAPPSSAGEPPYLLKGFTNVQLAAGASTTVTLGLTRYDLAMWNTAQQKWVLYSGSVGIVVGASSRDRRLTGTLTI